ncbi:MAG: sulfatase-like hydrolase/transferase [Planctomycetales bacterium]|nr:sulfatase-like hydrolase/transferase [Planctomycetales bacterium]NIM10030.1 sulfatase-like hydrolase/transferase [Planctomycetales bacterium]NIN09471.1 sulfatase-like hydrolase/transferase [Planctomycetales bacterium]NIN78579.1 sulfatase-like hydrolase/transferase [Planctomycetales bacterium]NIO35773.1 sulfatase-like hydrolase/transferase [Planctomycetales bacterium]
MSRKTFSLLLFLCVLLTPAGVLAQPAGDFLRQLQLSCIDSGQVVFGHWGDRPDKYSSWTNHSNRLIPVYTWGLSLDGIQGENSIYRDEARLTRLYKAPPKLTLNQGAEYFDQTQIYELQKQLLSNKKHVFLLIFDGMDWDTTRAAAAYRSKQTYQAGRGSGLHFLDYRRQHSDYGFMVSSPLNGDTKCDVNAQVVSQAGSTGGGGYNFQLGGSTPWSKPGSLSYLIRRVRAAKHWWTDSAASATSMMSGIKTYNGAVNVDGVGNQVTPIAREFQQAGYAVGIVSSVAVSHATPACAYANNVSRNDYQDITRDMLGLVSSSHKFKPLPGLDVVLGAGWGETRDDERSRQGDNYVPGNKYLTAADRSAIDVVHGGRYVVVQRRKGRKGQEMLREAAGRAADGGHRLCGLFGVRGGHLPYRTADGSYDPTRGAKGAEIYTPEDVKENPTLADLTAAAIHVLSHKSAKGFWLMVEPGDVDWANHDNNIDNAIGAVLSGDEAFRVVVEWVESNSNWNDAAVILTADHGHLLVLKDLKYLTGEKRIAASP